MPHGVHGGGADAVLGEDGVEVVEVAEFLVVHVLHEGFEVGVGAEEGGRLSGVDEDGGEFAGLVDAEGGVEEVALGGGEGLYRGGGGGGGGGVGDGRLGWVGVGGGEGGGDGAG